MSSPEHSQAWENPTGDESAVVTIAEMYAATAEMRGATFEDEPSEELLDGLVYIAAIDEDDQLTCSPAELTELKRRMHTVMANREFRQNAFRAWAARREGERAK